MFIKSREIEKILRIGFRTILTYRLNSIKEGKSVTTIYPICKTYTKSLKVMFYLDFSFRIESL